MRDVSMEQPVGQSEGLTFGDSMADETPSVETQLVQSNIEGIVREKLDEIYDDLNPRERFLLEKRLLADHPVTLEAAGSEWGVTRERVRQIESRLKKKLKAVLTPAYAA
jgi:RNA polymerase sigma-32 factor